MNNDKWICPFSYFPKVGFIFKKTLKEVHKSKILCHMCEYRDSSFMPCNGCDDLGSQFKKSEEVGVEIVKTEETEKNEIKYLNINVSNSEVERKPDIVRLCAEAGILEYVKNQAAI